MQKINIAELLKNYPQGMELDCTLFDGKVIYQGLNKRMPTHPIVVQTEHGFEFELTQYGQIHNIVGSKCVIFPKGKTTWEGFVPPCKFKDGDILAEDSCIFIIQKIGDNCTAAKTYCTLYDDGDFDDGSLLYFDIDSTKLATEEEKQKLFDAIKDNGYKWNAGTKTLEKLVEPKFKVGDRIRHKEETKWTCVIRRIDDRYWVDKHPTCFTILFDEQDEYELVPDKFDINTLYPLQPVLVRNTNGQVWTMDFFSHKIDTNKGLQPSIVCVSHCPNQCIPYKNNEFLRGTTDDCKDFYKIWEL